MTFSIKEAFKKAWKFSKENILVLIGLTSVIGLISWILEIWWKGMDKTFHSGQIALCIAFLLAYILTSLISALAQIGYTKILLKLYDGEEVDPRDIFGFYDRLWNFVVLSFLYGFIVLAGTILLVVPGIIFAIKYGYASYFVIDQNMRPVEALKASAKITQGKKWKLTFFGALSVIINLVGMLFFRVGFLFTMPFTVLASIHVFRILDGSVKNQQELPLNEEK